MNIASGQRQPSSQRRGWLRSIVVPAVAAGVVLSAIAVGPTGANTLDPDDVEVFVGVDPTRILDTRDAPEGPIGIPAPDPLTQDEVLTLKVAGNNPVPADATSVVINTTIDADAPTRSFITIYPTGTPRPVASANNATPGIVKTNPMIAKLGDNGSIDIYNFRGTTNLVVDVVGYFAPLSSVKVASDELIVGTGDPAAGDGDDGSVYIDEATGKVYVKQNGTWIELTLAGTPPTEDTESALYAISDGSFVNISAGTPVEFNDVQVQVGSLITQVDDDTFRFAEAGVYKVDYRLPTSLFSALGGVRVEVGGVIVGSAGPLISLGTSLHDTLLVEAQAGDTLEIIGTGLGLTLLSVDGASLTVELVALSTP